MSINNTLHRHVGEEPDDLYDDEGPDPGERADAGPGAPAHHRGRGLVDRPVEDTEEDEARGDDGVEHAEEDQGWDHKGEGYFLVDLVVERSQGGGRHGLVAREDVDDGSDDGQDCHLDDGDGSQCLEEVLGIVRLSNEARQRDLLDEGVRDVEEGAHGCHEGGAREGQRGDTGQRAQTGEWTTRGHKPVEKQQDTEQQGTGTGTPDAQIRCIITTGGVDWKLRIFAN
ncbi:hypothetical protein V502_00910 [Pseudogymnoascus sp. VKM F-4520 (FW-2644)]|nr:hypothetical protein V502_00910 [Pseudogymnoascus sp. VKM F-4520 (FW-2644)]